MMFSSISDRGRQSMIETNKNLYTRSRDWIQLRMIWQPQRNDDSCLREYVGLEIDQDFAGRSLTTPFFSRTYWTERSYLMVPDR